MSTILKALRRLEDDRNALSQRPLREEVATEGGEPARAKRIRVLGFAVLALCVAGGAGTFAFLSARESPVELASGAVEPVLEPAARARPERSEPPERARSIPEAEVAAAPPDLAPPPPRGLPPMAFASDVEVVARPLPSPRLLEPGPPAM